MKNKRIILITEPDEVLDNKVLEGFNIVQTAEICENYNYNSNGADSWREQVGADSFEFYTNLRKNYEKGLNQDTP